MSNQIAELPLWKMGKNPDLEFTNLKLLEKQEPSVYKQIQWREGFTTQDLNYSYRVGCSKWGLYLQKEAGTNSHAGQGGSKVPKHGLVNRIHIEGVLSPNHGVKSGGFDAQRKTAKQMKRCESCGSRLRSFNLLYNQCTWCALLVKVEVKM